MCYDGLKFCLPILLLSSANIIENCSIFSGGTFPNKLSSSGGGVGLGSKNENKIAQDLFLMTRQVTVGISDE